MSPNQPTAHEQLTLEEEAQVDAVCDRFERAWKEAKAGGPEPHVASYLAHGNGSMRDVLFRELIALDQACRERYGLAARPQDQKEFSAQAETPTNPASHITRHRTDGSVGRPGDWPSIPGLELAEVLGSGGMGVVYKARQVTLNRDVAVKFLRNDHRADLERRERFLQEARAVARLRHPHLVQLYEFGELPAAGGASQPYLVLEYVSGGSLADVLRGSPQSPAEAARLIETVAGAIHYAHQQGVIHRDLKPANVLMQMADGGLQIDERLPPVRSAICHLQSSLPKVTDFGLAKFMAGSDLTLTGDVLGTPGYMAPEQALGKSGPILEAVDVYGLGAILYETLTGRPPFAAATVEATLALVRQDEPVPPRRLQPTVPRDLETICMKCLRKEPGRRYSTAQDLAEDLRRFRAGEPIRARPVGTGERVVAWCRRKPGVAGLLAALVLVFLAGSVGVLWEWQRARHNAVEAEQNAVAFRQEWDTARLEKERAEHHLQMIRDRVHQLSRLGNDLLLRPGQYRTGQAVLEEALAFYKELLPEEGHDSRVRSEAAELFGEVGWIHHQLGQADKAAQAWDRQASLLGSSLEEEPASKELRVALAITHRWRGNMLRDLGKAREARQAYDQAAAIHEALLRESPDDARYQVALANTLLNTTSVLSRRDKEFEPLHRRMVELDRAAVRAAPDNPAYNSELALVLGAQGQLFLDTGQLSQAEAALREALEIDQRLLTSGHGKGSIERYAARNYATLGRVLAAAGQAQEAEESYRKAVNLLDRLVKAFPDSAYGLADLAHTLAGLADLLKDSSRRQEVEGIRRRVIRHYETLQANFPEEHEHRRDLVLGYLKLISLLWELGRQTEAAEPLSKALAVDPKDPAINNELAWFLTTSPEARLRDPARAVRLAKKTVAARPQTSEYRNTLGVAFYRNGDDKNAIAELETAMGLRAGGDSLDWFFLAMAHWRLGDRDQARTWFERAVQWMDKHSPQNDELRRFRAEAEGILGEGSKR